MSHKKFTSKAVFIALCGLAVVAVMLSGCSKSEDTAAQPPPGMGPGGPPGMPPGPGGPGGPPGMPPGPGGLPMPGQPGPSAAPSTAPAAPAAVATGKQTLGPNALTISKMTLKSPIKRVKTNNGDYLQFKYVDHNGELSFCDMPASEAKQPRSKDEWISTFDFYKTDMPTSKTAKKKNTEAEPIPGYLFVSPPPRGQ